MSLLLQALGGKSNVAGVESYGTRLRIQLRDDAKLDETLISETGLRGAAIAGAGILHVLADGSPEPIARELKQLIGTV